MSETILLPLRNYRPWAEAVADATATVESGDVTALLLHVFDGDELSSTRENIDSSGSMTVDDLAARKSGIVAARETLQDAGVSVEVRGLEQAETTADSILTVADEAGVERLYLYGRKRSPTGKAVFGSTLQRILLNATVPVTVVPSNVTG
ncbi:universal stress protein (plasmid) [Haladaptatus sp. SPP-AMP-3]|uniref:universal stress protein n=1 Tax=Haladaptatus sp. SPP-AMP-3 TaxID=3121295 RepID=UPI003C2F2B5C